MSVVVYSLRGNGRSQKVGHALAQGVTATGDYLFVRNDGEYQGPDTKVAAFYGYERNLPGVMRDYAASGRAAVYIDLGYWGRQFGGRFKGYHKVAVNARHPTAHLGKRRPSDRFNAFGVPIRPWQEGRHVLVAGMSARAAAAIGMGHQEWEKRAIAELRKHTDRPIIYRPKPSCKESQPIDGAGFSSPGESLSAALTNCHAVVTHHSNVAVDAILAGVPAFCDDGVAVPMGLQDLAQIETPHRPTHAQRRRWAADVAHFQWSMREIAEGKMWRFLKDEGLIP